MQQRNSGMAEFSCRMLTVAADRRDPLCVGLTSALDVRNAKREDGLNLHLKKAMLSSPLLVSMVSAVCVAPNVLSVSVVFLCR